MTGPDPLDRFLTAVDLDDLAASYDVLARPDASGRARTVVEAWTDVQAVANLLMYPLVLPEDVRIDALLRGLDESGYLRLAAAVGVGDLAAYDLPDDVRRALLGALLDVVASDAGPAGIRAAAEIGPLVRAAEVELLDDLAAHPVAAVRHNLDQARLGVTDPDRRQPVQLPYLPNLADYATRPTT